MAEKEKSEAQKEQKRLIREQKKEASGRAELERTAGSKIVPAEMRQAAEEKNTRASIKKQALESGMSEDQANRAVAESGVGSVTPRLDRMAGEQRRLEESRAANPDPNLQGFKTYGDKARFETQNAIRKLQGRQQLTPDTPEQFQKDIGTSMGFGEKSALLTPEGQARAIGKGVKSGLSPEAANAAVQRAFKTLSAVKPKTPPEQYGPPKELANVAAAATTTAAPKPPSATQTAAAELPTQTPEQAVREQVGNVVAGATGFNEGGRNAALQAAQGGSLAANLMRQYSKGAINKEVDAIAEAGGRTRTSLGRESKSLLEEYNKAKGATVKMQQLAKGATQGSPLAKGLATVTQKAVEAGTKSTDALKKLQAAAERSGAQKAADFGRKILGNKVLKGVGRLGNIAQVAEPILEAYKYNKNPELFDEKMEAILERNEAGIAPTIGAAVRDVVPTPVQAFNPNYSPVSTLAATIVSPLESFRRYSEAKGEAAYQTGAAEIARRKGDALTEQRRSMVSDEEYAKMSAEQKRESSIKAAEALRQLREAARKRNQ
jgi:hypothetical protein